MKDSVGQVPSLLRWSISQGTRPTTSTWFNSTHINLAPTGESMTDKLPVNQIVGRINSASGKELKCRGAKEECRWSGTLSRNNADSGIWVEAPDDRVFEGNTRIL